MSSPGRVKLLISVCLYSDVGMYDRIVIQEILKEIAQTQQVDLNAKQRFKGTYLLSCYEGWLTKQTCSCCHQRGWFIISRRTSCATSDNGEVYVEHAYHIVREQHKQTHCADQKSMLAHACGCSKFWWSESAYDSVLELYAEGRA